MLAHSATTLDLDSVIVALATPPGPGLRAVIRLSGRDAVKIVRSVVPDLAPGTERRQVHAGGIALPGCSSPLPADVFFFRAPSTYTGQDLVELHLISSMPLVELTITELLRAGARAAQPGEFTMRGFLAGKLDLTRAEAVHAVIEATAPDQLDVALAQLAGGVARPLDELRNDLLNLLADVEAGLDFADEDLTFVEQPQLLARIAKAMAQITLVLRQVRERGTSAPAFRVALAGPPNAGKSSLFNSLVGSSAAIVSPVAGTTRDYLEADVTMDGVVVRLIDTAGLAAPTGGSLTAIDAQSQVLGGERTREADLILWCDDSRLPFPPEYRGKGEPRIVATKADLGRRADGALAVSSWTGEGIAELKAAIVDAARRHLVNPLAPSLTRCRHHATSCLDHLRRAHQLALDGAPELLALDLRLALDDLGAIVGAVYTDDLLDRIFSRFCIGK